MKSSVYLARAKEIYSQIHPHLINAGKVIHTLALITWHTLSKMAHQCYALYIKYSPAIDKRLDLYARLIRLKNPIGWMLLLWPTLWALWIAYESLPSLHLLLVFTFGVFLTRSAGVVFNDIADRDFDSHVRRTYKRPVTTGELQIYEALLVAVVLLLLAFLLVLTTNKLTIMLSFVAVLLAVLYPFMKRYTYLPQLFLGLAFSWGIPMAFSAQTSTIPNIVWLLYSANILWVLVYDTIYAMVDIKDDIKIGVKSTAILFEDADKLIIGILQSMFLSIMIIVGLQINAGFYYYYSLILAGGFMIYHQYLIKDRLPERCFKAFLNNNWIGVVIFAGIVLTYL